MNGLVGGGPQHDTAMPFRAAAIDLLCHFPPLLRFHTARKTIINMKFLSLLLLVAACARLSQSFAPPRPLVALGRQQTRTFLNIGEQEREKLTRDSEPEEFFST